MLLILMGIIGAYVPRALDAGWRRSLLAQEERGCTRETNKTTQ